MLDTTTPKKTATAGYVWLGVAALLLIAGSAALIWPPPQKQADAGGFFGLCLMLAAIPGFVGFRALYDAQPLPADPIPAPPPLLLTQDQPWRRPTSLRYLESLKQEMLNEEEKIQRTYHLAVQAYNLIHQSSGRIQYDERLQYMQSYAYSLPYAQKAIGELTVRIDRLFAGDVGFELGLLEESVQKLQRSRQEYERDLAEAEAPCTINHEYQHQVDQCKSERQELREKLRRKIHDIDRSVIEREAQIRELREFDFKRLYRDLGLPGPPGLLSVSSSHIQDIRNKASLLQGIPDVGPRQPPVPKRSREEDEIERIVSTIDSIEGLKRAWTAKKRDSHPDQHPLIDRLFRKAIDARLEKL